jgi:hypothetical protein
LKDFAHQFFVSIGRATDMTLEHLIHLIILSYSS